MKSTPNIQKLHFKNRAQWFEARAQDVTASVVGALFGEHEFTSPYQLWASKTGRLPHNFEDSEPMRRGRLLEPVAVQILREMRPDWEIEYNSGEGETYYRDADLRLGATPDVVVTCPDRGRGNVQIKSVEASVFRKKWIGDNDFPEPPLWIALQSITEAKLINANFAMVMPIVVSHGIESPLIEVPIVDGVFGSIVEKTRAFWDMVDSGVHPDPDYSIDQEVMDKMYEIADGSAVDLTDRCEQVDDWIERRILLKEQIKSSDAEIAEIEAELKHLMGAAEVAFIGDGQKITWKNQRHRAANGYVSNIRVLRFPRAKADRVKKTAVDFDGEYNF